MLQQTKKETKKQNKHTERNNSHSNNIAMHVKPFRISYAAFRNFQLPTSEVVIMSLYKVFCCQKEQES